MPASRPSAPCGPRLARGLAAAAAVLVVTGCASLQRPTGDDPVPPTPVLPADWSVRPVGPPAGAVPADGPDATAGWWAAFGDDRLTALVRRAVDGAADVGIAQARLRQARAVRAQTAGSRSPQVDLGVSTQASRSEGDDTSRRAASLAPDASWQPDFSGRLARGVEAADADLTAAATTVAATRVSVAADTALAYLQLRGAQARLAIAEDSLAAQDATLRIARWRADAGLVSGLDVDQAAAAAAQTRAQLAPLRLAVTQQANALAVLTGTTPQAMAAELGLGLAVADGTAAPSASSPPAGSAGSPASPTGTGPLTAPARARPAVPRPPSTLVLALPADVLRQRPDVAVAEARVRAAAARVAEADAARLPSLSLRGSIGLNAMSLAGLATGATFTTTLAGSVALPLLDGGAVQATVRQREAGFDEARLSHRAAVLGALREVEDALVSIARQREQQAELATAVDAARRAAALADTRYRGGLVDFTTVLTTRRTLLGLEDGAAAVDTALAAGHVQLYKALGGGWTPSADTPR